ncbi:MAG TPA: PEP-CTERM sorting domain-containing protein [Phycisphaerae bacterium]|nr:PEP-CTERM sorting domain-containing protein [Phycisphaerae bacterium]HRW53516.1 PEP-CTERM sorting domain-containing protein [Phycisphaerae bacterium]
MMMRRLSLAVAIVAIAAMTGAVQAEQFELLTGVDAGMSPGAPRNIFPQSGFPSPFFDGDRLAGNGAATPQSWVGSGAPIYSPNQFGSLSFMFRRGSAPAGPGSQVPIQAIEYLGGPRLDLDGDLNNGQRSFARPTGVTPAEIPGVQSYIDLGINRSTNSLSLDGFDATGTNAGGAPQLSPDYGVTTNVLAGTLVDGSQTGPINPSFDTRAGSLTDIGPGVTRIDDLGYEMWQDSISQTNTPASETLGVFQYLGSMRGWLIERDGMGNFPTLAGQLGGTLWSTINTADVGASINRSSGGMNVIADGVAGDQFSLNPEGLPTGDLGAYLDAVVIPLIDPNASSFVYLEASGVGTNNSLDPVFGPTNGYDVVLIGQMVPEPTTCGLLLAFGAMGLLRRRRQA